MYSNSQKDDEKARRKFKTQSAKKYVTATLGSQQKSIKENSVRLNHKHQKNKSCIYMYMVISRRVSHDDSWELVMKISINENFDRSNHSIKMGTAQTSKSQ